MTDQDPRPLKASGETPAELVRALDALGRDRDAARLARVAESLGATLAATGAPAAGGFSALTGVKIALIGLALGLGAWGLLRGSPEGDRAPRDTSVVAPAAPVAVDVAPKPVLAPPTRVQTIRAQPEPSEASTAPAVAPVESAAARPLEPRGPATGRNGRARAADAPRVAAQPSVSEPTSTLRPEQVKAEVQPARVAAEAQAEAKPSAAKAPPPSELALLQRARRAAASQPEVALRLLEQHAARFPSGLLVPEREVLAIEVLRHLGRDADAERRLKRFAARYPKSIHLRRLERSASAPEAP